MGLFIMMSMIGAIGVVIGLPIIAIVAYRENAKARQAVLKCPLCHKENALGLDFIAKNFSKESYQGHQFGSGSYTLVATVVEKCKYCNYRSPSMELSAINNWRSTWSNDDPYPSPMPSGDDFPNENDIKRIWIDRKVSKR